MYKDDAAIQTELALSSLVFCVLELEILDNATYLLGFVITEGKKQSHYRPKGFQEVKVPRFRDNGTGWW